MNKTFKNLFDVNTNIFIDEKIQSRIYKMELHKIPSNFQNFSLTKNLNHTYTVNSEIKIKLEIINIYENYYEIKEDKIMTTKYKKGSFQIDKKRYTVYTTSDKYENLFFTSDSTLKKIINTKIKPCITLNIESNTLHVENINEPEKCGLDGLNEIFKIIIYVAYNCNFKNITIFDGSYILCENEEMLIMAYYRLLCGKHESIYNKYGFEYIYDPLEKEEREFVNNFSLEIFISKINDILFAIKNNNILIKKDKDETMLLEEFVEYIELEKIIYFLNHLDKNIFVYHKLEGKQCLDVNFIVDIIWKIGKFYIYYDNIDISQYFRNIKYVLDKYINGEKIQVKYLTYEREPITHY